MNKLILLVVAVAVLFACSQKENVSRPFVAKVNDTVISEDTFLTELEKIPEWARQNFTGSEGKSRFLKEMINKELIYQDAMRKGLHNDSELKEKVEEFRRMTLLSLLLQQEIEAKAAVSETEKKTFYEEHSAEFIRGAEVKARHILVDSEEKAKDILNSIIKGESFSDLAKTFSKDKGSAQKGGDLGFFGRGYMVPEFEDAAFSLKKGEVSQPVMTAYGYHIIEVTDTKEGSQIQYEEAKSIIEKQLLKDKQKSIFESYIENLRKNSTIETDDSKLEAIEIPWDTGG